MEKTVLGAVERQTSLPVGGLETDEEMDGFLTKREERIVLAEQWQVWELQLLSQFLAVAGDLYCNAPTQLGKLEPDFTLPGVKHERGEMGGCW